MMQEIRIIVICLSFIGSILSYAQASLDIDKLDSLRIQIFEKDTLKAQHLELISTPDIKSKNWNTSVYNPYKKTKLQYPFKLSFKDSTYASPMHIDKVITSRYGWRRGRAHKGIDIDLVTGDSLFAMFDGVVRFAKYNTGHGKMVIVRHYNGLETVYAHLSKYGVKANDTVVKGQYLGKGGATGNARGSHLHLEVNYKGVSIHPEYLFAFDDTNAIIANDIWVTQRWTQAIIHNSRRKSKIEPLLTKEDALASLIKKRSIYVVKPGDTLSHISVKTNMSISALCKTNAIRRNSVIRVGQKLIIEN